MDLSATRTVSGESADDIMGQFYFAFGQGAASMRIDRDGIAAFRRRYFERILNAPGPWKAVAPNVLAFVAQAGRLCAQFATQAGRTAITSTDVRRACAMVEAAVHRSADHQNIFIVGPHCSTEPHRGDSISRQPTDTDRTDKEEDDPNPAGSAEIEPSIGRLSH